MNLPRGYLSYNQIHQYQTCPQKYFYNYIEERVVPINEKVFLGIVFHSLLEYYFQKRISGHPASDEEIVETFTAKFADMQDHYDISWQTAPERLKKRGIAFTEYFLKNLAGDIQPMMVEKELEFDVPQIGIKLKGIIDLVEEDFSITDFKTTTSKWSKDRINKSFLQMMIYKYLFEHVFHNVSHRLKLKIIYANNSQRVKHQEVDIQSSQVEFDELIRILSYVSENIERGNYYKNVGYICRFCDFRDICQPRS